MLIKIVQNFLDRLGYKIILAKNYKPIDLREKGNNPVSLSYLGFKQSILVNASLEDGRGLPLFDFSENGFNPFVCACKDALLNSDSKFNIRLILKKYYELVQPLSASSLLGIKKVDSPLLANEPSWAAVLPWDEESISQWKEDHKKTILFENGKNGSRLGENDGWAWCGPVSNEKLDIETNRLHKVYKSIQDKGYLRHNSSDGDICGVALVNSAKQWRWQARAGQHRIAVLSALGHSTIPIRIIKIVKRDEVENWPNVVSGVFSKKIALKIFDNIFESKLPDITKNWIDYINNFKNINEYK
jgi:hypothetical protein